MGLGAEEALVYLRSTINELRHLIVGPCSVISRGAAWYRAGARTNLSSRNPSLAQTFTLCYRVYVQLFCLLETHMYTTFDYVPVFRLLLTSLL